MEKEGAKRVEVVGKDGKHQITAIFGISMSGNFLLYSTRLSREDNQVFAIV